MVILNNSAVDVKYISLIYLKNEDCTPSEKEKEKMYDLQKYSGNYKISEYNFELFIKA